MGGGRGGEIASAGSWGDGGPGLLVRGVVEEGAAVAEELAVVGVAEVLRRRRARGAPLPHARLACIDRAAGCDAPASMWEWTGVL